MVTEYYGRAVSLVDLRKSYGVSLTGLKLQALMEIASALRFSSRALHIAQTELGKLKTPAILHWDNNHYVILKKVTARHIEIHNPASGARKYSLEEVSHYFTGVALELTPLQQFEKQASTGSVRFVSFFDQVKGLKRLLVQLILLSFLLQIFCIASPFYMQLVVDEVLVKRDTALLELLAIGFLGLSLFNIATAAIRSYGQLYVSNQLNYVMGTSLFHHLVRLPLDFFIRRHLGDIVSRFGSLREVQEFITSAAITIVIDGLMTFSTLIILYVYSPQLALLVTGSAAMAICCRLLLFPPIRSNSSEALANRARQDTSFIESMRSMRTVKLFGLELQRQENWQSRLMESLNSDIRIGKLNLTQESICGLVNGTTHVAIIYLAANQVLHGSMSVGMLFAFLAYQGHFNSAVNNLLDQFMRYLMIRLHLERLSDIALTEKEPGVDKPGYQLQRYAGDIELKNAGYRYSSLDPFIYRHLDLQIRPGDIVAITGASGSGKSTLMNNLAGLIQLSEGELRVDGQSVRSIGLRAFRLGIASVLQGETLMTGSIAQNIICDGAEIDQQRLTTASRLAVIHEDVLKLPMGYQSLIGDLGSALSLGQQQRILIARALYKQPAVLLLDEGTAHIDAAKENRIMKNISSLGITCIYINHNRNMLKFANRVVHVSSKNIKCYRRQ
jgi:ATP-binding cassette subfamily B protein RaxB